MFSFTIPFFCSFLKGTVNLLQHIFGSTYRHLAETSLKQELQGGDALSAYLINLMNNLDDFINQLVMLPDESIINANVMLPIISHLLESSGLKPLLPLLISDHPLNASAVIDVASKLGRLNQNIFTFNETDPTMPELERLIKQFLSMEGNLTISLSHIMGHSLLTYLGKFDPDEAARLTEAIRPFTNQTSAGFVEAILSAMELLKKVMDSPEGDPTPVILGYIRQLQDFLMSLFRLQRIQRFSLPSGELSVAQVTDLHMISKELLNLFTPQGIQYLTQAGPDAAQTIIVQKFVALLPPDLQGNATHFFQDFKNLQNHLAKCTTGQNCSAAISEIFTFLDQILDLIALANSSVTIKLTANNSPRIQEYEEIASVFFPLLLPSNGDALVETFRQTLYFLRLVMAKPNITVSDVQNALRQSNLTLEELNNVAALAGAANINDLMVNIIEIINARQCFEPHNNLIATSHCVRGLINGVSGFLTHIPALHNETAILSLIPLMVNKTISEVIQFNFSLNPAMLFVHTLNSTLESVKMSLQMSNLNTPEIMNEIRVLEGLIQLAANPEFFNNNATFNNSMNVQKLYLDTVDWYLKRVIDITSNSSVSHLLYPLFGLTQMQVTLQLAQANLSFVGNQIEFLINNLQYPIDGVGLNKIGLTSVGIFRHLFELIMFNLEVQNNVSGPLPFCNLTCQHATKLQVKLYLDLIEKWMKQPNVSLILTSMLQWGNPSMNFSTPVKDLQHLLMSMKDILSDDQLAYLSIIANVTQSLNKALMLAEQPGGLQSDHFLTAILEAVDSALQILTMGTGTLPLSAQQNILDIVHHSLKLIVQPDMSFTSSRNISLIILMKAESVIHQIAPEMLVPYMLAGIKLATTYFETVSTYGGPDGWNQL